MKIGFIEQNFSTGWCIMR